MANQGQQGQQAQAAQAAPAIRGPRIRTFCSTDPDEFRTFERHVEYIVAIHEDWNFRRARLEIAQAMSGAAAEIVRHIDIGVQGVAVGAVGDWRDLLAQYRACFSTDAHQDAARGEFNFAEQEEGETLIAFHARLRAMFLRAYPNTPAADVEVSPILRDKFLAGLRDAYTSRHTYTQRPATYAAMLETATTMETSRKFTKSERNKGGGRKSVHQLAAEMMANHAPLT